MSIIAVHCISLLYSLAATHSWLTLKSDRESAAVAMIQRLQPLQRVARLSLLSCSRHHSITFEAAKKTLSFKFFLLPRILTPHFRKRSNHIYAHHIALNVCNTSFLLLIMYIGPIILVWMCLHIKVKRNIEYKGSF